MGAYNACADGDGWDAAGGSPGPALRLLPALHR